MLARRGLTRWHRSNPFWRYAQLQAGFLALALSLGGWQGLGLVLVQAFTAIWQLELVNYIEHYGLVRIPGTRVEARHSWDSHRRVSGGMFYNLMLHANHHKIATRRFWVLEQSGDQAPVLPRGYMAMILFAFLGSPFFNYINKHLARWDRELASPDEVAYLKAKGIYYGDLTS